MKRADVVFIAMLLCVAALCIVALVHTLRGDAGWRCGERWALC